MDERLAYFLLVAIPAVCVFGFLYAIIVTELANWLSYRRLRNYKPEASAGLPHKKPKATSIRGFDYPELFCDDTLQRIKELEERIAACNQEIESLRDKQ